MGGPCRPRTETCLKGRVLDMERGTMRASEVYEGYAIDAATHQAGPMRWGWTYLIDGKHSGEGAGRPLRTEALALMDAVGEAKARIRHWLRSGEPPPKGAPAFGRILTSR